MSANDQILNLTIRHQFYLSRLGSGNASKAVELIQSAIEDIEAELGRRWNKIQRTNSLSAKEQQMNELVLALVALRNDILGVVEKDLKKDLKAVALFESEFAVSSFEAVAAGIAYKQPSIDKIKALVTEVLVDGRTIKSHFKTFRRSERDTIERLVKLGVVRNQSYDEITQEVVKHVDKSARDIKALVTTATSDMATRARVASLRQMDVVKGWKIVATLDTKTSPECMRRDNTVLPYDSTDFPPYHYNCRTTVVAVTKSWREMGIDRDELDAGTRASMSGQVPQDLSYGDWLKTQPYRVQVDALGRTRAALFRQGELAIDKLIDKSDYSFFTVKELKSRYQSRFPEIFEKAA
ncbi:MAG: minor capsid protein [Pseudomonadota bacterium]|nr:minor capsid protein [Pseudomonadota bacterium]